MLSLRCGTRGIPCGIWVWWSFCAGRSGGRGRRRSPDPPASLDWREAFNARDAAGACDLFAPDLVYSVPEVIHGTQQTMCDNLERILEKPDLTLTYAEPVIHEVIQSTTSPSSA